MSPILVRITLSDYSQIAPLSEQIESQYLTRPLRLLQKSLTVTPHLKEYISETHRDKLNVTEYDESFLRYVPVQIFCSSSLGLLPAGFSSHEASVTFFLVLILRLGSSKMFNIKTIGKFEISMFYFVFVFSGKIYFLKKLMLLSEQGPVKVIKGDSKDFLLFCLTLYF